MFCVVSSAHLGVWSDQADTDANCHVAINFMFESCILIRVCVALTL